MWLHCVCEYLRGSKMAIIEALNVSTNGKGIMIVKVNSDGSREILQDNVRTEMAFKTANLKR